MVLERAHGRAWSMKAAAGLSSSPEDNEEAGVAAAKAELLRRSTGFQRRRQPAPFATREAGSIAARDAAGDSAVEA